MRKQPTNSPQDVNLQEFKRLFCPSSREGEDFCGVTVGETKVLYKKGKNSNQKTKKGSRYPKIEFSKNISPRGLSPKPDYIVFHSTESPNSKKHLPLGERFFLVAVPEFEQEFSCLLENSPRFIITESGEHAEFFKNKERSGEELKRRLQEFAQHKPFLSMALHSQ